jgi:hypothetical protein
MQEQEMVEVMIKKAILEIVKDEKQQLVVQDKEESIRVKLGSMAGLNRICFEIQNNILFYGIEDNQIEVERLIKLQ